MLRYFALGLYYGFARHFPTQPVPGWRLGYALRRWIARHVFDSCGRGVIILQGAYFGNGAAYPAVREPSSATTPESIAA